MHEVFGYVVHQEEGTGKQRSDRPVRRIRKEDHTPVEPDVKAFEQRRRQSQLGDQPWRDAHHQELIDQEDFIVGQGGTREPYLPRQDASNRLTKVGTRRVNLYGYCEHKRNTEITEENPFLRVHKRISEITYILEK